MKTRLIQGISKKPDRVGIIGSGKVLGTGEFGQYPVLCPMCEKPTNFKPIKGATSLANVCEHCHNCKIVLNAVLCNSIWSAVRLENFSAMLSRNWTDEQIETFLKTRCVNQRYVGYLGLTRPHATKWLNGQMVSTHAYFLMCRYVVFNIIPFDSHATQILIDNMVDTTGSFLLRHTDEYKRLFGQTGHNVRMDDAALAREIDIWNRNTGEQDTAAFTNLMRRILAIYDNVV